MSKNSFSSTQGIWLWSWVCGQEKATVWYAFLADVGEIIEGFMEEVTFELAF